MAMRRYFAQIIGPISHLPTWMLMIGTVMFWVELDAVRLPGGHTSWISWIAWGVLASVVLFPKNVPVLKIEPKPWMVAFGILGIAYLAIVFYASLLPPHLPQEYDAINYHLMLPRQHLLRHDFTHLSWSVADLFLLPLDYALSPFCLASSLPNKFPQFIFFCGVIVLVFQIVILKTESQVEKAVLAVAGVMALHMNAIQAGTAMLDMVMLYLVLAGIHSLMAGNPIMAAIEWAFFCWSKSFIPPMMLVVLMALVAVIFFCQWRQFKIDAFYQSLFWMRGKFLLAFCLASLVIALPHLVKSQHYAGVALYPFGVHSSTDHVSPGDLHHQWIVKKAQDNVSMKNAYGHGRGIVAFIEHFWLIAVPEHGVNNSYDYPVGLIYLLMVVPFCFGVWESLRSKNIPILSLFILIAWGCWWFGSQQTRFLMVPMTLLVMVGFIGLKQMSKVLISCVLLALVIELISICNAHRPDWGKKPIEVLRSVDLDLVLQGLKDDPVTLDHPDVAFAAFPVNVVGGEHSIFVIPN